MTTPTSVWDRVVAALDLTPSSLTAATTAAQLMPASATLTVCAVASGSLVAQPGAPGSVQIVALEEALEAVQRHHDAELHLRDGSPLGRINDEIRTGGATLVTLGAGRRAGTRDGELGPVTAALLHEAACSVLIAHDGPGLGERIVVGYDGSGGAGRALAAGRELAARLSRPLRVIVATGDPGAPGPGWWEDELESGLDVVEDERPAVDALLHACNSAELLIVGSRHLAGVLTRASVSEHAAARARCPVLVMR